MRPRSVTGYDIDREKAPSKRLRGRIQLDFAVWGQAITRNKESSTAACCTSGTLANLLLTFLFVKKSQWPNAGANLSAGGGQPHTAEADTLAIPPFFEMRCTNAQKPPLFRQGRLFSVKEKLASVKASKAHWLFSESHPDKKEKCNTEPCRAVCLKKQAAFLLFSGDFSARTL